MGVDVHTSCVVQQILGEWIWRSDPGAHADHFRGSRASLWGKKSRGPETNSWSLTSLKTISLPTSPPKGGQ